MCVEQWDVVQKCEERENRSVGVNGGEEKRALGVIVRELYARGV